LVLRRQSLRGCGHGCYDQGAAQDGNFSVSSHGGRPFREERGERQCFPGYEAPPARVVRMAKRCVKCCIGRLLSFAIAAQT
jgi:hypothetical protein